MRIARGLMADPEHFDVLWEVDTNLSQRMGRRPDPELAAEQWTRLRKTLIERGVEVTALPSAGPGIADWTFVANAGLKIPGTNVLILSNFRHEQRLPEIPHLKHWLKDRFELIELATEEKFEGAGDAFFWQGGVLFIGYGIRTNLKGALAVARIVRKIKPQIGVEFLPMRFYVDQGERGPVSYYHRDMCLLPLQNRGMFFMYPPCFEWPSVYTLNRYGSIVPVTKDQAYNFVCNGIEVDADNVILPWADGLTVTQFIQRFGCKNLHICPTSEFHKSGGGPQCLFLDVS